METDKISQEAPMAQAPVENEPIQKSFLNQKGSFLLILSVVIIILVIGAGGYFLYQKQVTKSAITSQQTSQPTPSPIINVGKSDLPIYPNVTSVGKESNQVCKIQDRTISATLVTTTLWKTIDNYDQVANYYLTDQSKSGWKCIKNAGNYNGPKSANAKITCTNGGLTNTLHITSDYSMTYFQIETPNLQASPTTVACGEIKSLPLPSRWNKYQPSCQSLAAHMEIYYPDGWKPKEFGNISDAPDPNSQECQVIFGYPVESQSYQAPTPGQLTSFKIQTFINKVETLDQRVQAISNQAPYPSSITKVTANGVTWSKVDYDQYSSWLSTKMNDRFYEVYLIGISSRTGSNLDSLVFWDNADNLNNEILNRIRILP